MYRIQSFEIQPKPDVARYLPAYPEDADDVLEAVQLLYELQCANVREFDLCCCRLFECQNLPIIHS